MLTWTMIAKRVPTIVGMHSKGMEMHMLVHMGDDNWVELSWILFKTSGLNKDIQCHVLKDARTWSVSLVF